MQEGLSRDDISPELLEQSSVYRELVNASESVMEIGISPGTAALIVAAVPITLKLLRMANELVSANIEDWLAGRRIARRKQEADTELEIEAKRTRQKIELRREALDAGIVRPRRREVVNLSYDEFEDEAEVIDIIED